MCKDVTYIHGNYIYTHAYLYIYIYIYKKSTTIERTPERLMLL